MIPWIQVYSNLVRHPKVTSLADELGLPGSHTSPNAAAVGMLVSLWLWAAQNATDGDLSKCSDRAIAEAAEYRKKPAAFVAALIKTRWLDEDRKLHDWEEYASLLHEAEARSKENAKNRAKRYRDRKRLGTSADNQQNVTVTNDERHGDVTVTSDENHAGTLPNHTLPNITLPNTQNIIGSNVEITDTSVTSTAGATHGLQYGSRQNVSLTQSEYDRLILDFGEVNVSVAIETMGKWLEESGENSESHYALLRRNLWKNPTLRSNED